MNARPDFFKAETLDSWAERVQSLVRTTVEQGGPAALRFKSWLNGTWLGHPLHPALTDVPIGAWSAGAFSVLIALGGGSYEAAAGMVVIQLLSNGPLQQIVQPVAYGAALGIHPLAVLIVTIAGGALFGAVGLILAAPLTAAIVRGLPSVRPSTSMGNVLLSTSCVRISTYDAASFLSATASASRIFGIAPGPIFASFWNAFCASGCDGSPIPRISAISRSAFRSEKKLIQWSRRGRAPRTG